jgi:hypothetical protein
MCIDGLLFQAGLFDRRFSRFEMDFTDYLNKKRALIGSMRF